MVVRTRLRSIVMPIAFYLVLGAASSYLVWGASNGEHGLKAKEKYAAETETLQAELASSRTSAGAGNDASPPSGRTASTATFSKKRRTASSTGWARTRSSSLPRPPPAAERRQDRNRSRYARFCGREARAKWRAPFDCELTPVRKAAP